MCNFCQVYQIWFSLLYDVSLIRLTNDFLFTGICPFIKNSSNRFVIHYHISLNGIMTALLRCTTLQIEYLIVCGLDGQWEMNNTDICIIHITSSKRKLIYVVFRITKKYAVK